MSSYVKVNIYKALEQLLEDQFKEFKWILEDTDYDGKPTVPKGRLEKADKRKVVDLMIQSYGEDAALKVCIDILQRSNVRDVAANLKEATTKDVVLYQVPYISGYRSHMKRKFSKMEDPNSCFGDNVYLNQRYSKLIIDKYLPKREREHEIIASGKKHAELMNMKASSSITVETLFKPDEYGLIPQVVVLQGAAGIGKTMTARKIMFDWASERLYQDMFNYVFYIHCREMNLHTDREESSIVDILLKQWPRTHAGKNTIEEILRNPEKLLFIIDGFDELRFFFDRSGGCLCTDPWKKTSVSILLNSLFQKKVLPESYLIITTRPTALENLHRCLEHPHYVEILGFSIKEREEYFHNFFENKDHAAQAFRLVKQNDTLFTMCVIPLVCWIICTVMKQEMERDEDLQQTPYTLTAVYLLYLSSLLKFHHKESNEDIQRNLKGLCSLAAEGIWNQQILFTREELKKHNLDQEDSLPLFLNENIFKRDINRIHTYNFIHLSFQEFFAALFYILEEGEEQHSENLNEQLGMLLKSSLSSRRDLAVTVRFLFGFLNEEERVKDLKREFGWKVSPKVKEFLLGWVKNTIKQWGNRILQDKTLGYLYEAQDDCFVKDALEYATSLNYDCKSAMELMILTYCIQHCRNLETLCIAGPSDSFEDEIKRELFPTENLLNHEESLMGKYMERFFIKLEFRTNVRTLSLFRGSFPEPFCRLLAEAVRESPSLRLLDLSPCDIAEKAVKLLCEGLEHPGCKLEQLRWCCSVITPSCSKHLAEALKKSQTLTELTLLPNDIGDKAFQLLCEGLKHPECKLQNLRLSLGILGKSSSEHLAEVLRERQTLRELALSPCEIREDAMELLCEGLKHPSCKVEKLELSMGFLTESSYRHLGKVLRGSQRLTEVDLTHFARDVEAFEMLCEGLKHPECKLEKLKLRLCCKSMTVSGYKHFAEVLRENSRLRELDLIQFDRDDRALEMFCEGLKHPKCRLEKIRFSGGFLPESFCGHLAEVLRKNQKLRELVLSPDQLFDKAKELLCEELKHPVCRLEKLWLNGECIDTNHKNGASTGIVEKNFSFMLYLFIHLFIYFFIYFWFILSG
ncbi:NACHT, LRR and PYD domains-containing protein 12-like isoform X2 [Candoia aspera]|uniref:NACHT, LRR and PYD domains-containing protein 12-like isoform X2 n=1 Tax=Candoia aspera TaxID=51853 RepID=UPI002FD858C2